jgi:hypothetical protein
VESERHGGDDATPRPMGISRRPHWRRFLLHKGAVVGLALVAGVALLALLAPLLVA